MMSPFDTKNKAATLLDRLAVRLVLFVLCVAYFLFLWRLPRASLIAGSALFALLMLALSLWERSTLARRDRALRERVGGMIALEDLTLMPGSRASERVCATLCRALCAEPKGPASMRYEGHTWLVRCAQCLHGSNASEGDVLAAHRARVESGDELCALASTGGFSPAAVRAAEWVDPPIRLIPAQQLCALFGRLHPATDEEIARHARRQRTPFSFSRMRSLALSPAKLRRYLLCTFLLLVMYLSTGSAVCLISCLLAFLLALCCHRARCSRFRL